MDDFGQSIVLMLIAKLADYLEIHMGLNAKW